MKPNQRERAWLLAASLLLGACGAPVVGGRGDSGSDVVMDTRPVCTADQMVCNNTCVSVQTDRDNCGACGTVCPGGQVCRAGTCEIACPSGQANCAGACVTLSGDRSNCGACGTMCPAGQVCSAGACATTCASGLTDCMGSCRDVQNDRTNCGACGTMCPSGQVCSMGACATSCPMGQVECAGACVNTQSDRANCGACGTSCAAGQICTAGVCTISCLAGQTVCGGTCTDTQTDRANCGMCGTACAAGQVCNMGTCELSCAAGQTVCSGACTNTQTDRANCGMCGTACAAGQVCSMGVCTLSCSAGQTNCSDSCVSLPSDPSHCGACGTVCGPYANAIASCGASTCIMTCNAGFADCNAMRGDGCEINQNTDVNNCGRCGNRCSFPNATAGCGAGACQLVSCNAGFENADGIAANGCEQRVFRAGTMGSPFGDGTLRGLTDDPMAGGITPSGMVSTTTANFLWIVNVNESSISKWDANMATELARYRVGIPAGECVNQCCHANGCNMPSRVVVDGNGDVYIANRAFGMQGTVTKIAGDRRDCIDRNGNGMIDTSTGATNVLPFTIAAGMGMGQPADECVLWTANVGPVNDVLRALAIDRGDATSPNGSPWVGNCNGTMRMYKLNSRTGAITNTLSAGASGCLYGAVGTADGRVWFHNSSTSLIPVNTLTNTVEAAVPINQPSGCRSTYGITADGAGRIWLSTPGCNDIAGYRPSDNTWTSVPVGFVTGLGITSDSAGNIWTHKWSNGDTLVRFPASAFVAGGFVPAAMVQRIPTGRAFGATSAIGADLTGTMWFVSYDLPSTLVRYVPSTNVFTNFAGPNRPYSYTDFTGSVRRTAIPQGTWERTIDLGCANPNVSSVVIDATAPMDTAITLTARSAATVAGLAAATDVSLGGAPPVLPVYNVSTPYILAGQTIGQQFRLTLLLRAAMSGANPLVRSVRVNWTCP